MLRNLLFILILLHSSDPESPSYAKHYSPEQVIEMFKPSDETVEAVKSWLVNSGIAPHRITHSDNKGWLAFDATAEEAEGLLRTEYHTYEHAATGHKTLACDQ